ncbi:MAG TPA: twin-arginine translocation signal domain-containing protein [Dehalococcoidia bacterium]|nr:twin-arginine translocation signal domain-containing protein [Dehalococcoidia bacterium]
MFLRERITRRRFIVTAAVMAGAAASGLGASSCEPPAPSPAVPLRGRAKGMPHLAWAWHFGVDGSPERMASVLAQNNLGLILKSHNGTEWMSKWDSSSFAISGPTRIAILSNYFERYGIPFHTYCVLQGLDPQREAAMCADVISAGARSVFIDVEPWSGYWQGTPQAAQIFGQEFRRLQPDGALHLCVEPRPWVLSRIPMAEFASVSQGIAPMVYWETFNTSENVRYFEANGFPPGPSGICPEFVLDVSYSLFAGYKLPIYPVGQGASSYDAWVRFMSRASQLNMGAVSVWRYGVANPQIWPLLRYVQPNPPVIWGEGPGLAVGSSATVANTGACLNLRKRPSVNAGIDGCLFDRAVVTLVDGPVDADGYRWWLVECRNSKGWAAEGDSRGTAWLLPS